MSSSIHEILDNINSIARSVRARHPGVPFPYEVDCYQSLKSSLTSVPSFHEIKEKLTEHEFLAAEGMVNALTAIKKNLSERNWTPLFYKYASQNRVVNCTRIFITIDFIIKILSILNIKEHANELLNNIETINDLKRLVNLIERLIESSYELKDNDFSVLKFHKRIFFETLELSVRIEYPEIHAPMRRPATPVAGSLSLPAALCMKAPTRCTVLFPRVPGAKNPTLGIFASRTRLPACLPDGRLAASKDEGARGHIDTPRPFSF